MTGGRLTEVGGRLGSETVRDRLKNKLVCLFEQVVGAATYGPSVRTPGLHSSGVGGSEA
jgi:hypothetical protein